MKSRRNGVSQTFGFANEWDQAYGGWLPEQERPLQHLA
jgi:hypothetical protein